jgi:chemotaxis protein MotB
MISMSDMNEVKVVQILQAFHETFGFKAAHDQGLLSPQEQNARGATEEGINRERELSGAAVEIASLPGAEVSRDADGITVTMEEKTLFNPGSATLREDSQRVLTLLATVLKKNEMLIHVEGHTDNLPVANASFPSNWELSAARAVSVVVFLEKNGIAANRLSVVGYGDAKPVAENHDFSGRQKNRRVELKLTYGE